MHEEKSVIESLTAFLPGCFMEKGESKKGKKEYEGKMQRYDRKNRGKRVKSKQTYFPEGKTKKYQHK